MFRLPSGLLPSAAALTALVVAAACAPPGRDGRAPGVLLIAVDGLRADHVGVYGYDRDTTPGLDGLAAEGLHFHEVFAGAPQLMPAHASLLTGCAATLTRRFLAPEFEGFKERRWRIAERSPHVAVEFLTAGYTTAAFVDHESLSEAHGYDMGFQHYEILAEDEAHDWEGGETERVVNRFLQWVSSLPADRPWFAYLELNQLERSWSGPPGPLEGYFEPRPELDTVPPVASTDSTFFAVPRSRWRRGARTLGEYEASYDGEIRALDAEILRLRDTLSRGGRLASTSIHVVGSYGVQFGESGLFLTAGRYSRADLGVPWIVRPRAGQGAAPGRRLSGLVSLLDVAPTLLELEGITAPRVMHGLSQAEAVRSAEAGPAPREFVFASAGLQEGCAVFSARHGLEYLFPLGTVDAGLRRSWRGERGELGLQPMLYFYDRLETPYPDLAQEAPPAGIDRGMRVAAIEWLREMSELRRLLQEPPGAYEPDENVLRRLIEKGFVEATP